MELINLYLKMLDLKRLQGQNDSLLDFLSEPMEVGIDIPQIPQIRKWEYLNGTAAQGTTWITTTGIGTIPGGIISTSGNDTSYTACSASVRSAVPVWG